MTGCDCTECAWIRRQGIRYVASLPSTVGHDGGDEDQVAR